MRKIESMIWKTYYERLEQLRMAKNKLDKKEITQEEFDQLYDEVELLMSEVGE